MKTPLQKQLAKLAPSIHIETIWQPDNECGPISKECDGFGPSEDEKWQAWKSEVRANAIVNGQIVSGSSYLGGTWAQAGDLPGYSNPGISGHEPQMTIEALEELSQTAARAECTETQIDEIQHAINHINSQI